MKDASPIDLIGHDRRGQISASPHQEETQPVFMPVTGARSGQVPLVGVQTLGQAVAVAKSKATNRADPSHVVDGVVRYCIAKTPDSVALTSVCVADNVTLPRALSLADSGAKAALPRNDRLVNGANTALRTITHKFEDPRNLLS
ncbi:hypothetical protein KBY31_08985 [Ruegeria pomeroyi]|nr:hypothetical protein [Ruegeria pomeroyi]